jgi:hypothetical protein
MHFIEVKQIFSQNGLHGYQKAQNFMKISKILSYLCDKMHPKKDIPGFCHQGLFMKST